MESLLVAFLFFLPAGIANMSPVFASRVPLLNRLGSPLDFGKSFRGIRILGDNKTWRGLLVGVLSGGLTSLLVSLAIAPGAYIVSFLVGCLLGFGALFGDAVESFFKRQRGVPPGKSWFPFDQIDYIIGGLLFVYPLIRMPITFMIAIFIIYFGLHLLTSYIGYLLGLKKHPI